MKALFVQINGKKHCLAGMPNGGLELSIGLTREQANGPYGLAVYGCDLTTEQVSHWPIASLNVGDEIRIALLDADEVDPPAH